MTRSLRMYELIQWELRRARREPACWLLVVCLAAVVFYGYDNGLRWANQQQSVLFQEAAAQTLAERAWRARAEELARPGGSAIAYWQDPTDIAGFSRYALLATAGKPVLPLAALAIGNVDLHPYHFRVKLDLKSTFETSYEIQNPLMLALGRFDLAFVLVVLLPLAVIMLGHTLFASERELGITNMVLAQPVDPWRIWLAKALTVYLLIATTLGIALTLSIVLLGTVGGGPDTSGASAHMVLSASYLLLWTALGALLSTRRTSPSSTTLIGVMIWLGVAVALPALSSLAARALEPIPSRIAYIDALRKATDDTNRQRAAVLDRFLYDHPEYVGARGETLNFATARLIVVTEIERSLKPLEAQFEAQREGQQRISRLLDWLSPSALTADSLSELSGNGHRRQQRFMEAVDGFHSLLRAYFVPRVLGEAASPSPRQCEACPGRLNFTDYDSIPRFTFIDDNRLAVKGAGMVIILNVLVSAMLLAWTRHRARRFLRQATG